MRIRMSRFDQISSLTVPLVAAFYLSVAMVIPVGARGWDAPYHLSVAKIMAETKTIPVITDSVLGGAPNYHPPLFRLLAAGAYLLFVNASESMAENAMRAIAPIFGALTLAVVYAFGKRIFDERRAYLTMLTLASFPIFIHYSVVPYVETTVTFFVTIATFSAYLAAKRRDTRQLILCGLASGLACLTKYSGIPAVLVVLVVFLSVKGDRTVGVSHPLAKDKLRMTFLLILLLALTAGPWYLRNYALYRNPIAPFLFGDTYTAQGADVDELTAIKAEKTHSYDIPQTILWSYESAWELPVGSRLYAPYLTLTAIVSLFAITGLIVSLKNRTSENGLMLLWILSYAVQLGLYITQEPIWIRTSLPAAAPIAYITNLGFAEISRPQPGSILGRLPREVTRRAHTLVLALIVVSLISFGSFQAYRSVREGKEITEYFPTFQWIRENTPKDSTFLTASTWETVYYSDRKATWFDERVYAPHKPSVLLSDNETYVSSYLNQFQVSYVLIKKAEVDQPIDRGGYPRQFLDFAEKSKILDKVYEDENSIIFHLVR